MKKSPLIITLILSITLSGCSLFAPAEKGPLTLVDDFEREVTLTGPVDKIISLVPSSTEILFALGVGEKIVGATVFCNYPAEAAAITRVGDFDGPNLELILSLEPDLVFAASLHKDTVEALEGEGIAVLALDPQNIEEIYGSIKLTAKAVGAEKAGEELVADMKSRLAAVKAKVAGIEKEKQPLVFYEVWYPEIMVAGAGTFIDEIITLAGGRNMAWDIPRWGVIQEEEVLARNPDIIIHGYPGDDLSAFSAREGWQVITAVSEGRFYFVDPDITSRTGPRIAEAVELFAEIIHPELFND